MANSYLSGLLGQGLFPVSGESSVIQIWGLTHLAGQNVSCFLAGRDTGDFTVASDGSITINLGTNTSGLTTALLIASAGSRGENDMQINLTHNAVTATYQVPCVIGAPFVMQGQMVRPGQGQDVLSQTGPALAKTRRVHRAGVLFQDAVVVNLGTALTPTPSGNMLQVVFKQADGYTTLPAGTMFSGVYRGEINDGYGYDGMVCWQVDRPWPCTVCSITGFLHAEEP